nr:unnamed protein product [Callosobruchus analis]
MDDKHREQLMRWYEECESDDESLHDPYSTDDSIADPEYTQNDTCSSSDSEYEHIRSKDQHKFMNIFHNHNIYVYMYISAGSSQQKRKRKEFNQNIDFPAEHSDSEDSDDPDELLDRGPDDENTWENNIIDCLDFSFDSGSVGVKQQLEGKSAVEVFECIWTREVNNYIVQKSNEYGDLVLLNNRPKSRNERFKTFQQISLLEMKGFLGLCLLAGQLKFRSIRDMFSLDPFNYHPIFPATMSRRRFEQILRCLNCSNNENNDDNLYKVSWLVKAIVKSSKNMFSPPEALSLDESLLLFRGQLKFRVYIKNKKSKYGIKFYELCSSTGYVLNIEIYKGKSNRDDARGSTKINSLVLRLLQPFLDKGHHIYMDNFYNSVQLSEILLKGKTHTTGTLR